MNGAHDKIIKLKITYTCTVHSERSVERNRGIGTDGGESEKDREIVLRLDGSVSLCVYL